MTQQPPDDRRPAWEGGNYFPPPNNPQYPQSPRPGQPFSPQFPSGQYPPIPQQGQKGNPQFPSGQYQPMPPQGPPQGYPQQQPQGYPQQQNYQQAPQGYPQQQNYQQFPQQPPMMQPPTQPKKRGRGLLIVSIIAAVLVFGCIGASLLASHNGATATTSTGSTKVGNTAGTTPTAIPTQASTYKVGDVVKVDDSWEVTVISAKADPGTDIFKPKSGNQYLVLNLAMKNLTTENHTISSLIQFTLRSDDGTKYNNALYAPDGTSVIDGDVDGGQPAKGIISYEVPTSIHSFHLTFESVTSAGRATWNITV